MREVNEAASEPSTLQAIVTYGMIAIIIVGIVITTTWQTIQFYRTIHTLKALSSFEIHELKIYPRVGKAKGIPIISTSPDTMLHEFGDALKDIRAYRGNPSKIMSLDHVWFIELETTKGQIIQMPCHLPENGEKIVHGELGKFYEKGGGPFYGRFQSEKLFQWYQKHSSRWLGEQQGEDKEISIKISP